MTQKVLFHAASVLYVLCIFSTMYFLYIMYYYICTACTIFTMYYIILYYVLSLQCTISVLYVLYLFSLRFRTFKSCLFYSLIAMALNVQIELCGLDCGVCSIKMELRRGFIVFLLSCSCCLLHK